MPPPRSRSGVSGPTIATVERLPAASSVATAAKYEVPTRAVSKSTVSGVPTACGVPVGRMVPVVSKLFWVNAVVEIFAM